MKLEIRDISVSYDADVVLNRLSLSVREGEFLSLLGPSGCGKSTLLKTIAGLLVPSEGSIRLDGREITRCPVHKRGTVVVFQDMRLFPHMNVENNVAFPLKMQGVGKAERLEIAREILRTVQMDGFATVYRENCPEVSSSGSPWPGCWRRSRSCCSWMSPSPLWMRISGRICARSC